MTNRSKLKLLLSENMDHLSRASKQLSTSYLRCRTLSLDNIELTVNEQEKFEALTSRFSRLADIIIQKTIRLIELIELENTGSVLDRINKAEKKGFIESAEQFIEIRLLRNSIAHEYDPGSLMEIFKTCVKYTPILLDSVSNIQNYIELNPELIKC